MGRKSDRVEDSEAKVTTKHVVESPAHLRFHTSDQASARKDTQDSLTDGNWGRGRGDIRGRGRGRGRGESSPWTGPASSQGRQNWSSRGPGRWPGQGRGFARGGRWPGQGRGPASSPSTSPPSPLRHSLGPLIESLTASDLVKPSSESDLKLTGFKSLVSYNWLDNPKPTIAVPGSPRRWSPSTPRRLPWDEGVFYRDHDALLHPSHPTQPAIEALLCTPAPSTTAPVNIVACSNTLFSLYSFAAGEAGHFRMLVETIGGVVHLIRRENPEDEKILNVQGFGHTFVDANMSWGEDVSRSLLHRRIIRHDFAGISTIVRFVADGYLPDKVGKMTPVQKGSHPKDSSITVTSVGQQIPHDALFDLKTRSIRRITAPETVIAEYLPRLWLCQIPNFIVGLHDRGLFTEISIHDIRPDLARWESEQQENLGRFAALLRKILAIAHAHKDGKLEINYEEGGTVLEIREQTPGIPSSLPSDTERRWKDWLAEVRGTAEEEDDSEGGKFSACGSGDEYEDIPSHLEGYEDAWRGYSSDEEEPDYTACSAHDCGYCGHCTY